MILNEKMEYTYTKKLVLDDIEKTDIFSDLSFLVYVCMLLEERCRVKQMDVKEMVDDLRNAVYAVNNEFGKY